MKSFLVHDSSLYFMKLLNQQDSNMKQCASKNRLDYAAVTKITLRSQGHKTQRFTFHVHTYHTSYLLAGTSHMTISTHEQPRKNNSAWKVESQKYLRTLVSASITNCKPLLSEFYIPLGKAGISW